MLNIAKDVIIDAPLLQVIVAQLPKFYDVRVMNWGSSGIKLYSSRRAVVLSIPSLVGKSYAEVRKFLSAIIKSGGFVLRSAKPVAPMSRFVAPANEMYTSRSLHGDDGSYSGTTFDTPDVGVDMGVDVPQMEHGHDEDGCGFPTFKALPPMEGSIDMGIGIGLTADASYH